MGTKRQREEVDSRTSDRRDEASGKRQRSYVGRKRQSQEDSGARKRARAIERSLRRNQDMPANIRIDLERELAAQKQTIEDKDYKRKRSTMISRYHMVRFFERKKATRLAKQLKRRLEAEEDPSEIKKIQHDLHIAEVDEAYTLYFPHLETYVGLYSSTAKKSAEDETEEGKLAAAKAALEAERPSMWKVVEMALAEGPRALEKLRDRRSPDDTGEVDDSKPPIRPPAPVDESSILHSHTKKKDGQSAGKRSDTANASNTTSQQPQELNRRERRRLMRDAMATAKKDEEDEDGGFFEEL